LWNIQAFSDAASKKVRLCGTDPNGPLNAESGSENMKKFVAPKEGGDIAFRACGEWYMLLARNLMAKRSNNNGNNSTRGQLDLRMALCSAAEKLKGNMDAGEYKHVVVGPIFLKYICDAFEAELHDATLSNLLSGEGRIETKHL
jgi:hypothetical protein